MLAGPREAQVTHHLGLVADLSVGPMYVLSSKLHQELPLSTQPAVSPGLPHSKREYCSLFFKLKNRVSNFKKSL